MSSSSFVYYSASQMALVVVSRCEKIEVTSYSAIS